MPGTVSDTFPNGQSEQHGFFHPAQPGAATATSTNQRNGVSSERIIAQTGVVCGPKAIGTPARDKTRDYTKPHAVSPRALYTPLEWEDAAGCALFTKMRVGAPHPHAKTA